MTGENDWAEALESLRWHWSGPGGAYDIYHYGPDRWLAMRRDNFAPLKAESPDRLRDLIIVDYFAHPVPRTRGGDPE